MVCGLSWSNIAKSGYKAGRKRCSVEVPLRCTKDIWEEEKKKKQEEERGRERKREGDCGRERKTDEERRKER